MDTELVIRAQRGDEQAFASLAVAAGDRLHAVAHRILCGSGVPRRSRRARGAGTTRRRIAPGRGAGPLIRLLPDVGRATPADELESVVDRDQLERAFRRLSLNYEPGPHADRLRVQGLKITLDNGWGTLFWWQPDDLVATIDRADQAGWQVAIHTVSTEAHEMVLDAYEAALDGGPNTLHHRIDHAIQVTDVQLARMAALDLATVIHLDGAAADWVLEADYLGNLGEDTAWLARWRDFVDAGLHVAAAVDAPWIFPGFALTDDIGRPVDQIAGGLDGKGRANPAIPGWVPAQSLTAEQGLRAVTIDAAWALGDEQHRGHLAPGTNADITILSGDVLAVSPDQMRQLEVIATVVGGVTEYCTAPEMCP